MVVNPNKVILWNSPKFGNKELELVKKVLKTGYVSEGPMTKELEKQLGKICHAKHIIMTTNATAALYLAIEADKRIRDYKEGSVMIPNLTFIATKNAVEMAGLECKYEDVDLNRFLIYDVTIGTNIIIPVNLLGRSKIWTEGEDDGIATIICDNAGCLGSNVPNGKVGCYSLQANKLLTCGQGGFCATDDDEYAKVIREIKDFGRKDKYDQDTQGFNFKFNDIQAAVVLGQLEQLEARKELHLKQYNKYCMELDEFECTDLEGNILPRKYGKFIEYNNGEIPLWIEFITDKRDELFEYLKTNGVEARKPWKPLIDNPILYPNTDYYTNNCLWLPNGASLKPKDLNRVISLIKKFYEKK